MEVSNLPGPFAALSTVVAFVAHFVGLIDAAIQMVWATVPAWYPALAISASTIIPKLGSLSVDLPVVGVLVIPPAGRTLDAVVVIGALLYVGYRLDAGLDNYNGDSK